MVHAVIAATAFDELGVGVSIQWAGTWRAINLVPSVNAFEIERGNTLLRYAASTRDSTICSYPSRAAIGCWSLDRSL
jgi:hypothetical protein